MTAKPGPTRKGARPPASLMANDAGLPRPGWWPYAWATTKAAAFAVTWLAIIAGLNADMPGLTEDLGEYAAVRRAIAAVVATAQAVWAVAAAEPVGTSAFLLWSGTVCYLIVFKPREAQKREYEAQRRSAPKRAGASIGRKGPGS